jgi:16S rRNA (adenine1518-N6/adenine1519-N6)-dimethyltransferase
MHKPRKRFGQNFLVDTFTIQHIIQAINLSPEDEVIEIGPGQGALTKLLLSQTKALTLVEIDRDLAEALYQKYGQQKGINIICEDALKFDFKSCYDETKLKIVGNLPYNISTPLLFHLFDYNAYIKDMHFMLQKEVVDRMVAAPNTKEYGRLSIMTQYFCKVEPLFEVPPTAFFPVPKVQSAVVRLIPHLEKNPLTQNKGFYACLDQVVKTAFSKRRKTIANALKEVISSEALSAFNINPQLRAENLSVENYIQISHYLNTKQDTSYE